MSTLERASLGLAPVALAVIFLAGCDRGMEEGARLKPLDPAPFFADGQSARLPVPGTVPRDRLGPDPAMATGLVEGKPIARVPLALDRAALERGRDRYVVFCSPCHGRSGYGEGMIVRRGYRRPPSFHIDRLREAPPGHVFDVITRGFGAMPDHAAQIPVEDRWRIVAFVRALQLSQYARREDVPEDALRGLESRP